MNILKQSTAVTIVMGPMLDGTDGNTPETALSIAQADIRVSKNGGAYAQTNNAAGATHMEFGKYSVPLNTTDTATLGKLRVDIHKSGALAVWREFTVVPAHIYNTLVLGTDKLEVDIVQMNSNAQSAIDLQDFADAGYDPATNKVQGVVLCDTTNTNTDKTGYALSAAGIDSIHDEVIEGSLTSRQITRILLAVLAGKSTGGGTVTLVFRDAADSKPRITATVDANGNRTAMTVDGT